MPDASSVDRVRRALLLTAPLALSATLPGACSRPQTSLAELAASLDQRLAAGDRSGFFALFTAQPGSQALAARIFTNLAAPGGTGARISVSTGQLAVDWAYPREPTVASLATATVADSRIANLSAHSTGTEWLAGAASVRADRQLVVAAADAAALNRWWTAGTAGLAALATVAPPALTRAEPVVVLAPSDLTEFGRYAGSGADTTAAVTVVPGTADSLGFRVVVNPSTPDDPGADAATITHEAVHAGMGSPRLTGGPGWLLEGIAEALTAQAHPGVAAQNRRLARAAIAGGPPVALPDPESGSPAGYALAQVAVHAMVEQVGWAAVLAESVARSKGAGSIPDDTVLAWYRDALARSG